ncbi:MAG TPA: hypothetical protein VFH51_06250, partial [Myxococcota bacterium]|nr:hypothetical protein [Myxococcota bacterium]
MGRPHRIIIFTALLALSACGAEGDDYWDAQERTDGGLSGLSVTEMARRDRDGLDDTRGPRRQPFFAERAYAQLFGGPGGVRAFFDDRI